MSFPYYDTGSNVSATDNWPVSGSDNKDIAYKITVTQTTTLDISTCNADTDFDTKLSIFDACDGQEIYYIDDNYVNGACSYNVLLGIPGGCGLGSRNLLYCRGWIWWASW